jgi:hypothetical protein
MNATKQRLHGWKEIASHFSRSVRCVQRWERTEKLPVHRHNHARGSTVYAFLKELEAWQSIERAGELNFVPSRQKQEALSPQTASASRARRVSQNQSAGESSSLRHSAWSAADLQTIARQMALFFLRATRNASATRGSDRRVRAQSVQ